MIVTSLTKKSRREDVKQLDYLHVDIDLLDESLVPGHGSGTTGGPCVEDVLSAIDVVMSTGKVAAFAVVSTSAAGENGDVTVASGIELVRGGLQSWRAHGIPARGDS